MHLSSLISRSAIKSKYLPLVASTSTLTKLSRQISNNEEGALPRHAEIIICGGGLVGNSTAYHLTQKGKDVLVLEKNKIGGAPGSTGFDSGRIGHLKPIPMRRIIQESLKLYRHLNDLGYNIGFQQCGSISLAQTKDRMIALKRRMAYNTPTGLYCELITKEDVKKLHPYLYTDDLECGVWVPEDATADPRLVCQALVDCGNYNYRENCTVENVIVDKGQIVGVQTDAGEISCDYFINCAGMWARDLGLKSNPPVRIPAYPVEQFCAISSELDLTNESLPIIYDFDSYMYSRQLSDKLLIGWFEREATPISSHSYVPQEIKEPMPPHIKPFWEKAIYRVPHLEHAQSPTIQKFGQTYTPDGRWIVGEAPEIKNYFVGCGMNGNIFQAAGGIGKVLAEWLIEGRPTQDLLTFNIERFLDLHNNRQYLEQRVREVVGRNYAILYPHQCEYKYARKLRSSPLFVELEERGAIFGTKMAYERALYFDTTYKRGYPKPTMPKSSFYRPKFFEFMREEYLACRESVGIIDISSFSKIEIKSPGNEALNYLQRMCSNDVDIDVESIVQTSMLNEEGCYENDCMLVRIEKNSFFMVSPSSQQTRIYNWMSKNLKPSDGTVHLDDVTSMYTVINVVGPKASLLMSELSNSDINLHPFTFKKMNVAYASDVFVMSFTHTGEPGYCLYVPSEYALHVYGRLMIVGRDYGAKDVGTLTQRFMRIERFIPFWAEELTSFVTPFEAGMGSYVQLKKNSDFIGKEALIRQKNTGLRRRLCMFHVEDLDTKKDIWPWGGEPLYRNGQYVGVVTSVGYGFSSDKLVCLGFIKRVEATDDPATQHSEYITNDYILDTSADYNIDIAGKLFRLTPYLHAPMHSQEIKRKSVAGKYKPTVVSFKK